MSHSHGRLIRWGVAVAAISLLLAGCGSSSNDGGDSGSVDAEGVAEAQAVVDQLYEGTYTVPGEQSQPAVPGKKVWIISLAQTFADSAAVAEEAKNAAEALGWDVTVYDGQFDPNRAIDGMRQAVVDGADAIVDIYYDCAAVKSGLLAAREADVVTVGIETADCPGKPLFSHVVGYNKGTYDFNDGTLQGFFQSFGGGVADYFIAKSAGKAKVISFEFTDAAVAAAQTAGLHKQMEKCTGCEVVQVEHTGAELGPALQQKAEQAFLEHPDATAVAVEANVVLTSSVLAALRSSGLYGKVMIGGAPGNAELLKLQRDYSGDWVFSALPPGWEAYAAVDAANSILAGAEPPESTGIGLQLIDKTHNEQNGDSIVVLKDGKPLDFAAAYAKAWGKG